MLILIDDDFSHLYISTEQIKTVSIFLLCPLMKNPRWPPLISKNQVSAILALTMNIKKQKNPAVLNIIESYFLHRTEVDIKAMGHACKTVIKTNIYFPPITTLDRKNLLKNN